MKYVEIALLLVISVYPLSYTKYNWGKKNKIGAVGAVLLAVSSVIVPSVLLLLR